MFPPRTQRANASLNTVAGCAMPCHREHSAHLHPRLQFLAAVASASDLSIKHCSRLLLSTATGNTHRSIPSMDMLKCLYVLPRPLHPSYLVHHVYTINLVQQGICQIPALLLYQQGLRRRSRCTTQFIQATHGLIHLLHPQDKRVRYTSTYISYIIRPALRKRETRQRQTAVRGTATSTSCMEHERRHTHPRTHARIQ